MMQPNDVNRLFDILDYQLANYPRENALAAKQNGVWQEISTKEYIKQSHQLSAGLLAKGVKAGDKIAVISNNRPEWNITDIAIQQIGAIMVPIYSTISQEDYVFIFNHAEISLCIVSDESLYQKVKNITEKVPALKEIYTYEAVNGAPNWKTLFVENPDIEQINAIKANIFPEDLATIIYTSGTTGAPKGVMLSHKNLVSNVKFSVGKVPLTFGKDRALSFLPICHVYERMFIYAYQYMGVAIYYAENIEKVGDNIREIKPEVFSAVPRLLEKIFDKFIAKGKELTGITKMLYFWAIGVAERYNPEGNGLFYNVQLLIARKLIFSKWREALGGNIKFISSGSAALQARLARVFNAADITILEGYGLTETSPVISVNTVSNMRIGSVGMPLDEVEVRIAEDGEILTKSDCVMLGYYKNPENTAEEIDAQGYFHTGDIGKFEDGYLFITDRKKEMFKTSGGKYVAPQPMENIFKASPFIEQIMVVGESRKFPAALIVPDFAYLESWAKLKGISCSNPCEITKNPQVIARVQKEIETYNEHFGQWEKIKKFVLLSEAWTIDNGALTPTLKLKRKVITERYAVQIEELYQTED
jgi:long-chain acyl-CoA synthetase